MSSEWVVALAPIAGLGTNALTQSAVAHVSGGQVKLSIVLGALCGLVSTFLLIFVAVTPEAATDHTFVDTWLFGIATYAALAFGLWAFINLNITSLRIRTLRELLRAGEPVAVPDLLARYTSSERQHRRLERLESGGQIRLGDGHWRLASQEILLLARCIESLRTLILGPKKQRPGDTL